MKKVDVAAIKYAEALIKIAKPKDRLDAQAEELNIVNKIVLSNEDIMKIFQHPSIKIEDKELLLKDVVSGYSLSIDTINLLLLLLKKNKLNLFKDICVKYQQLVDILQNRYQIDVVSAVPLKKEEEEKIITKLSNILQAKIRLNVKIDPKILGGLILRIGDKIIDGSIRRQLFRLREKLT